MIRMGLRALVEHVLNPTHRKPKIGNRQLAIGNAKLIFNVI